MVPSAPHAFAYPFIRGTGARAEMKSLRPELIKFDTRNEYLRAFFDYLRSSGSCTYIIYVMAVHGFPDRFRFSFDRYSLVVVDNNALLSSYQHPADSAQFFGFHDDPTVTVPNLRA